MSNTNQPPSKKDEYRRNIDRIKQGKYAAGNGKRVLRQKIDRPLLSVTNTGVVNIVLYPAVAKRVGFSLLELMGYSRLPKAQQDDLQLLTNMLVDKLDTSSELWNEEERAHRYGTVQHLTDGQIAYLRVAMRETIQKLHEGGTKQ